MRCYGFMESGSDYYKTTKDKYDGPVSTAWRRIATRYMRKCARAASRRLLRKEEADTHPDAPYLLLLPYDYLPHGPNPWVSEGDIDTLPWWIQEVTDGQGNVSYMIE